MSPEQAIKEILSGITDITNLVSGRLYPDGAVPEKTMRPFCIFAVEDSKQDGDLGGTTSICRERISVAFFADTRLQAKTLSDYASRVTPNGLVNYQGSITVGTETMAVMGVFFEKTSSGVIDMDDGSDARLFRESSEFTVVYEK